MILSRKIEPVRVAPGDRFGFCDSESTMKTLLLLTRPMVDRCFAPSDLARLAADHEVVVPDVEDASALSGVWQQHAGDTRMLITGWGTPALTEAMLDAAAELRVMVHAAGSIKHLVTEAIWRRDLRIGTCREALAVGVAETTLGMMIAGLKGLFPADRLTAGNRWKHGDTETDFPIREMFDVTVGIIGASMVGRHTLRLLQHFEVRCLLNDPHVTAEEARQLGAEKVELDELMRRSDVCSLHAPALPSTRHMLDRRQFRLMPDHAVFINTARGMIVEEDALIEELRTGRISAFIDVTDPEPPRLDHPFRTLPNVVLTPHLAGAMSNGCRRLGRSAVDQLLQFVAGRPMEGEVVAAQFASLA